MYVNNLKRVFCVANACRLKRKSHTIRKLQGMPHCRWTTHIHTLSYSSMHILNTEMYVRTNTWFIGTTIFGGDCEKCISLLARISVGFESLCEWYLKERKTPLVMYKHMYTSIHINIQACWRCTHVKCGNKYFFGTGDRRKESLSVPFWGIPR